MKSNHQFNATKTTNHTTTTNNTKFASVKASKGSGVKKRGYQLIVKRSQKRLNSSMGYDSKGYCRFHKLDDQLDWHKWKQMKLPLVSDKFGKDLLSRVCRGKERSLGVDLQQLKVQLKIREVERLRQDIERTKQNNRLIKMLQNEQEHKINCFFNHL